jgi:curved DNA-binding protein CbpA
MAIDPDPYRTLGLARGASREEIRRAYRRLAKIHHPDAAGPGALPRFLAIQAAYEQLILRSGGRTGRGATGRPTSPRRQWEADPDRSDATRRAYGGRSRATGSTGSAGSTGATGSAGSTRSTGSTGTTPRGERTASSQRPGPRPAGGSARDAGERPGNGGTSSARDAGQRGAASSNGAGRGEGRRRNKATLGSTSYDDAGPFEPDWGGASWYGTTSGTYWTVNPKEYADPRKHGPEYQARARRASRADDAPGPVPLSGSPSDWAEERVPPSSDPSTHEPAEASGPASDDATRAAASSDATHTTSSWWQSTAASGATGGSAAKGSAIGTARSRAEPHRRADTPPPDLGRVLAELNRALTDDHIGGMRGRVARAVIGWLPIAFGIGWLAGELTGCGRFAASCDGTATPVVLFLQGLLLAVLVLVPALASIAVVAAMTLLGAAVVASLVLSATGAAADSTARQFTLGSVLLISWLAGLAIGVVRRLRELPAPGRPVS